ncbi:c-type cytochrome [Novosphingobium panipatense]|uniref:Cytochrome C oxidase, cbb3-type, subunit III n=2 Tax=Novosphingobium panipatense TaxID=428991 RepID=A0ABY1PZK8_9SPHN|nr:c-type cytochrome [Novosphingobium panipatense]SMP54283.1 Cytochrome C oxidase, cbb3-type, subunit III [Novosphingobium panipatense]
MMVKITWRRVVFALCAVAALGMAVAWLGLVPIAASSGHWRITTWFLHWTMQNSARTYSAINTPEKVRDDDGLISAAGHFRQACQVCHGAPGVPPSPVMHAATPHAPDLAGTAAEYTDRELFWIVRHGIKYTGMPAWPETGRDDEVRRMVSFVRQLPTMSPQQYRALTQATEPGPFARCTGCHGADGLGRGQQDVPVIAGQKRDYLLHALRLHAARKSFSAIMQTAVSGMSDPQLQAAADHFAAMPGLKDAPPVAPHPIVQNGLPGDQLPACRNCHTPGRPGPLLEGQRAGYLAERLRAWRGDETVVDVRKPQDPMAVIARRIPEDEIDAIATSLAQGGSALVKAP